MSSQLATFAALREKAQFVFRHVGPQPENIQAMVELLDASSLDNLMEKTIPKSIYLKRLLNLPAGVASEREVLSKLKEIMSENQLFRSYLGQGFSNCVTPAVIQRNILENPGWYTAYTPYQAEIAQGRLEALVNFQTMIADLSGLPIANASLLDEGTAAAEAMAFCYRVRGSEQKNKFFVSKATHPHVAEVVKSRADVLDISIVVGEHTSAALDESFFGSLLQYPTTEGHIFDYKDFCAYAHQREILVVAAADLLSLALLKPPGEWGADVAVGNTQRFGVPLGFGGPHAAYFATRDEFKREIPGRLVGISKDSNGQPAYRLSLQTREQHIRRDKATSNICTSQVLLAVISSMYAVYHGPRGVKRIAEEVHEKTCALAQSLAGAGFELLTQSYFDTIQIKTTTAQAAEIRKRAESNRINLRYFVDGTIGISLDETTRGVDLADLVSVFTGQGAAPGAKDPAKGSSVRIIPESLRRTSAYLTHTVFNSYHSETEMLRYLRRLESKDLSLTTSMIPLGSCTMKLNATVEMYPVTWAEVGQIHPFVPLDQIKGYQKFFTELESWLAEITGLPGVSLQPNAGSQGEYAGLLVIRAYHAANGDRDRRICLIPTSAHGTNPASAVMAGFTVVPVGCDSRGNINVQELKSKAAEHKANLGALMVTYPSTHGVFDHEIKEICEIVHANGGQVYMDGANMNAQVGLCRPGDIGADVVHINLHKTFCIPHGGGGPGMGPICVGKHLAGYLPGHPHFKEQKFAKAGAKAIGPVSSAPWGSASILPISWVYMNLMGAEGLALATKVAILNANYVAKRLEGHYAVLYRESAGGYVAHECIFDMSAFKRTVGIDEVDIAKRLMDYGFHAPTVSFPLPGTLMVEPTESESQAELDRFCDAMIAIREEIREIESGKADKLNNVIKNAPHTAQLVSADEWTRPYSREKAAYPLPYLRNHKYWPTVGRIDNAWGDRNFIGCCTLS